MINKRPTGKAFRKGKRFRHKGRTYWFTGHAIYSEPKRRRIDRRDTDYPESGLRFVTFCWPWQDLRRAVDEAGQPRRRRKGVKRRRYGRIHPEQ